MRWWEPMPRRQHAIRSAKNCGRAHQIALIEGEHPTFEKVATEGNDDFALGDGECGPLHGNAGHGRLERDRRVADSLRAFDQHGTEYPTVAEIQCMENVFRAIALSKACDNVNDITGAVDHRRTKYSAWLCRCAVGQFNKRIPPDWPIAASVGVKGVDAIARRRNHDQIAPRPAR